MPPTLHRLLLVCSVVVAIGSVGLVHPPMMLSRSSAAWDTTANPTTCAALQPAWRELGSDLTQGDGPIAPGRAVRLSDGTIAVLLVVTAVTDEGKAVAVDVSASLPLTAVLLHTGTTVTVVPFDPPRRDGSALSTPDRQAIDAVGVCYRLRLPDPPIGGATLQPTPAAPTEQTPALTTTPTATPTVTPEIFDLGVVQTASALQASATAAHATIVAQSIQIAARDATREAVATAAQATIASLATEQAEWEIAAAATSTAIQATASAEVAAARSTSAALATAEVQQQTAMAATLTAAITATPTDRLLFGVPDTERFDAWAESLPDGWLVEDGQLVAAGRPFAGYVQPAQTVAGNHFAVEAEIRIVAEPTCDATFGLLVRGSKDSFNAGGVEWMCEANAAAETEVRLWAGNVLLAGHLRAIDHGWHTYRVEVDGDQLTVKLDGEVLVTASDARGTVGDQVAMWSHGVQLEVRTFRILMRE